MTDCADGKADLEALLAEAVRALSVLDAEAIEGLAQFLEASRERVALPRSPAEWLRLRSRQWILGHLLNGTGQRLEMLRRVSSPPERFEGYAGRALQGEAFRRAGHFAAPGLAARREDLAN